MSTMKQPTENTPAVKPGLYYALTAGALLLVAIGAFNLIIGIASAQWINILIGAGLIIGFGLSLIHWVRELLKARRSSHLAATTEQ